MIQSHLEMAMKSLASAERYWSYLPYSERQKNQFSYDLRVAQVHATLAVADALALAHDAGS